MMKQKRNKTRLRASLISVVVVAMMMISGTALAHSTTELDGPSPAIWLSDPDGVDGDSGIEQGDPVDGTGTVRIKGHHARIKIKAKGLEPGHAYTMWIVYFNDQKKCIEGCNGPDFAAAGGGVIYGAGKVADHHGNATFTAKLTTGDGADYVGDTPPPPFAFAPYEAGADNEFHVVIRSHGPKIHGQVHEQLSTFGGGCEVSVGPMPEQEGDFPVPSAPGECGNVQLYGFK